MRIILHLDMDYFFAQIEECEHPEYKGRPLVVCVYTERGKESGVVSTANYDARKYGVNSGISVKEALSKLSGANAVFLPVRHEFYAGISQGIMETVSKYSEKFEYASIDEAYLDITRTSESRYTQAQEIAKNIKNEICEKFHLTCSLGIGPNRLIAKIAGNFKKPGGLTIVRPEQVNEFLEPMDVNKIPGIGKKTSEFLAHFGIRTIKDLKNADLSLLAEYFGKKTTNWLYLSAHGRDESEIGVESEQKQISRITVLKRNTRDVEKIMSEMNELIADVAKELEEKELCFSVVGITLIDQNLKTYTKTKTLAHATNDVYTTEKIMQELFASVIKEKKSEFRRAGIKIEKLKNIKGQKNLGQF